MTTMDAVEQTESLALVVAPEGRDAYAVFTAADTTQADRILGIVRRKIDEFLQMGPDVTTKEGQDLIRSFAHRITKSKTAIDAERKRLADEQKEIPKRIDRIGKHMRDTLDAWRDEVRKPLTDWEAAEKAREDAIKERLAGIQREIDDRDERSAQYLKDTLIEIEHIDCYCDEAFGEYASAAVELKQTAIATIQSRIAAAEKREAEQAELARLRAEAVERAKKDREEQIAREAAEKARKDAEAKAEADKRAAEQREADLKAAVAKAAEDKRMAEERAVAAARKAREEAEFEAAQRAEREAAEQRKREADKAHRARINRAALEALTANGIAEDTAKTVITLIATGKVPGVKISY